MFKSSINTLVKYKLFVVIGGFLVAIVVGVFIFSKVVYSSKTNIVIIIKPALALGPCFNNQTPPKTTIVTPAAGTKYTEGDKVALSGLAVLECDNSKIEDKDLSWYLNSETAPFASGLTYSLEGLRAGDHKIRLAARSGKLTGESVVSIRVDAPKPQVLGIKTPPPAPPPVPPLNLKPIVTIVNPRERPFSIATSGVRYDEKEQAIYYIVVNFNGTANDPEDGKLTNLKWSINGNPVTTRGTDLSYEFISMSCDFPSNYKVGLEATDKEGQVGSDNLDVTIYRGSDCPTEVTNPNSLLNLNVNLKFRL